MILLPAIDLVGGRCVRLAQGDFARETRYADDPAAALRRFAEAGASEAHVVDLDGARTGTPAQHPLLARLVGESGLKVQVAGGIRSADAAARLLDAGAARVVIGSLALTDPTGFAAILERFGADRVTLALDVNMDGDTPLVATHGWARGSGEALGDVLARFPAVRHLLVTDIARDGMMQGPNVALMTAIRRDAPQVALQASGGVAGLADLDALRAAGAARAIVGKAIWEGAFSVAEGVRRARG